ncbi:MAG: hypothetical protein COS98_01490 [Parcubacteria group bacterium CG07_land_8_20_14_0_80_35_11]|nr:MAG: hypothetical protein COS98_01490 [Parcubacteria group bacterium CG07_land_8_20_14_0_80_35_11]
MAFSKFESNSNFPRKMFKGNWKCSECGKEITELPFEPSGDRPLYCRECHAKRRPQRSERY